MTSSRSHQLLIFKHFIICMSVFKVKCVRVGHILLFFLTGVSQSVTAASVSLPVFSSSSRQGAE